MPTLALICLLASCNVTHRPKASEIVHYSPTVSEKRYQIQSQPRFMADGRQYVLCIDGFDNQRIPWPENILSHKELSERVTYTFEVLEARHKRKDGDRFDASLLRVRSGNHVLYDGSSCKVHQTPMSRKVADFDSASDYTLSFLKNQPYFFPFDGHAYWADFNPCNVYPIVWVCPSCAKRSAIERPKGRPTTEYYLKDGVSRLRIIQGKHQEAEQVAAEQPAISTSNS